MEPDRYQHNHRHYIIGLTCLVTGLALFAFGMYVLPFLLFNWHYLMPDFVSSWQAFLRHELGFGAQAASWLLLMAFLLPGVVFVVIADILSNHIDNQIHGTSSSSSTHVNRPPGRGSRNNAESRALVLRIVLIILTVFILARLFEWAIMATLT